MSVFDAVNLRDTPEYFGYKEVGGAWRCYFVIFISYPTTLQEVITPSTVLLYMGVRDHWPKLLGIKLIDLT